MRERLEDPAVQGSLLLKIKVHYFIGEEFIAVSAGSGHGDTEGNTEPRGLAKAERI